MTFYSGVDMNIDPEEKILHSTFADQPRERTPFEKESESIDMTRDQGYRQDIKDEDWWGIPQMNVMNQVQNMRMLENSQRSITTNPMINYVTENQQYDAGFVSNGYGAGRGYLAPPQATSADLGASATSGGFLPMAALAGPLVGLASSFLAPLISKGVSALTSKMGNSYKKGSGQKFPLSKREIAVAHSPQGVLRANPRALKMAEDDILRQRSSGAFWKTLMQKVDELSGPQVHSYFKEPKYKERYGGISSAIGSGYTSRMLTGTGLMSPQTYKQIVGGKYDSPEDDDSSRLCMGHVIQPALEHAVTKAKGLGSGMNADEKQALLDLLFEADREGMSQPVTRKALASGGGLFPTIRRRVKEAARRGAEYVRKSEPGKGILARFRQHIREQLPKRLSQFAEKGIDVASEALPEGHVKDLMRTHKDTIKMMGSKAAEHVGKQLGERVSKKLEGSGAMRRQRIGRGQRFDPIKKKNWHIQLR